MSANTFIELNDTPSSYANGRFVKVVGETLRFEPILLDNIGDVDTADKSNLDVLTWNQGAGEWQASSANVYTAGNGISLSNLELAVDLDSASGLALTANGLALANTGVTAGVYGNASTVAQINVDAQGRILDVTEVGIGVASLNGVAGQIIVTGNSEVNVALSATGVDAGVYGNATHIPQVTVDSYGRVSNVTMVAATALDADGNVIGGVQDIAVTAPLTGGGSNSTVNLGLANSGVTPGGYGNATAIPQVVVDQYGRITSISTVTVSGGSGSGGNIATINAGTGLTGGGTTPIINLAISNTGVSAGTYGNSTHVPQFVVNAQGQITDVNELEIGAGVTSIDVGAASLAGDIELVAGANINITADEGAGTVTIASNPSASGAQVERFRLNYNSSGEVTGASNTSSGISGVTVDGAASGEVTVTFTGYNYPPSSIQIYGYDYTQNQYVINAVDSTMTTRVVPGGGTSGSPTAFGSFSELQLKLSETETGASRDFGTSTHAWIQFVMMG